MSNSEKNDAYLLVSKFIKTANVMIFGVYDTRETAFAAASKDYRKYQLAVDTNYKVSVYVATAARTIITVRTMDNAAYQIYSIIRVPCFNTDDSSINMLGF
jgi:hypothetical protein